MRILFIISACFIISVCLSVSSFAQLSTGGGIGNKVYFGGGFDFNTGANSYGDSYTYVSVSPLVGYRFTEKTSAGAMLMYAYHSYPSIPLSLHQYGISPFVRYQFAEQFFAYAELNMINTPASFKGSFRSTYTRGLLGGGYSQRLGEGRLALNAMVLYDVLYNARDRAFPSPWVFRIFLTF